MIPVNNPEGRSWQDRVTVLMIRVIPYGTVKILRWHGVAGERSHFTHGAPERIVPLCGEPVPAAYRDDPAGEIDCETCCRYLVKRNLRGP